MNALIIRCLLACACIWPCFSSQAADGDSIDSPTKEIILVNYDELTSSTLENLASYASSVWSQTADSKITVTSYTVDSSDATSTELGKDLIKAFVDSGIDESRITIQTGKNQGTKGYFSISINSSTAIQ